MDLDSVAQDLYGLPLGDFVTARNDHAKQARADGDRELAAEIQALGKPTTAAWLVNQLSREHADDLEPLLDLGRELRDASAKLDGETMRRLGRRRTDLVGGLLTDVRRLGTARGSRVSDEVADEVRRTLEASLSDSEIAEEISKGRMTRAVEYAGFGEMTGFGGPTGIVREHKAAPRRRTEEPTKPETKPTKRQGKPAKTAASAPGRPTDLGARRRQRAEREVAEAAARVKTARAAHVEATEECDRTEADVERTEQEVQRLRAELSTAEREAKTARQANRAAQQRLASTERELAGVERIHDRAQSKLADLD